MFLSIHFSRILLVGVFFAAGCTKPVTKTPIKLSVLGFGLQAGDNVRADALNAYTAKTGIEFDLIPTPGTSSEQLPLVMSLLQRNSENPDILLIDGTWPSALHAHLVDLTPYRNDQGETHAAALLGNNTIQGRLVALPFYVNGGMLFYRSDLLKKYGYSAPPATWRELAAMALRIQQGERKAGNHSFWGYIWQGGAYEGLTCNALEWQVSNGGGQIVSRSGTIEVDNPQAREAMQAAAGWIGKITPKSVLAYTETDTTNVFRAGNAVFMRHWSSAFQRIRETMVSGVADLAMLPAGSNGRAHTVGGFQLAVSAYSKHRKEAAEAVAFLTGYDAQRHRAIRRGLLPTYLELYRTAEVRQALPQVAVFAESASTWVFRPAAATGAKYSGVSKAYYEGIHGLLSGKFSSDRALSTIDSDLKKLADGQGAFLQR